MKKTKRFTLTAILMTMLVFSMSILPVYAATTGTTSSKASSADSYYRTGRDFQYKCDYENAAKYYTAAVKAGSVPALLALGYLYEYGLGVPCDLNTANDYFVSTCKAGNPDGLAGIGSIYKNAGQYDKALEYYKAGMKYGSAHAYNQTGMLYCNGTGVKKDYAQAYACFKHAADMGCPEALANTGICFENGQGVKKDNNTALAYYKKAAEMGLYSANMNIARLYRNVNKDNKTAFSYVEKAANSGYIPAMTKIGAAYYDSGDYKNAFYYLKAAADKGTTDSDCYFDLGYIYDEGKGVTENNTNALYYYRKAAELGSLAAMYNMGCMYEYGDGVDKNITTAKEWYIKAANNGDDNSATALVRLSNAKDTKGNTITKEDVQNFSDGLGTASDWLDAVGDISEILGKDSLAESARKWAGRADKGSSVLDIISGFME